MTSNLESRAITPHVLRSCTPPPNEKVLSYLEGMERFKASSPSGSQRDIMSGDGRGSPRPEARDEADGYDQNGHQEDGEDFDSNAQEQSENGDPLRMREPGPSDPPGPHYESYDSGPSFGNMGPLPPDDYTGQPYTFSTWAPQWNGINGQRQPPYPAMAKSPPNGAANIPLPASVFGSPKATSMNVGVLSPTSVPRALNTMPSGERPMSPPRSQQGPPRVAVPPVNHAERGPLSPTSMRSHITGRTKGTMYPPIPESGTDIEYDHISPADSASQVEERRVKNANTPDPTRIGSRSNPALNGINRPASRATAVTNHQNRPFSPYRHAHTVEDLLNAATRGRALVIPQPEPTPPPEPTPERTKTPVATQAVVAPPSPPASPQVRPMKSKSTISKIQTIPASVKQVNGDATPRALSPAPETVKPIEQDAKATITKETPPKLAHHHSSRTSLWSGSVLEPEAALSPYHDVELCALFGQLENKDTNEFVKKALRKAIRQRVKKLGWRGDNESLKDYQAQHSHLDTAEPPPWAADLKREIVLMQQRIESLGPKIESLHKTHTEDASIGEEDDFVETPRTQTVNIHTQPEGTLAESLYQPPGTEVEDEDLHDHYEEQEFDNETERQPPSLAQRYNLDDVREESPGQVVLEEEFYKLQQKHEHGSQSSKTHQTWQITRDDGYGEERTIPGSEVYGETRTGSPPLPPVPDDESRAPVGQPWEQEMPLTPWQKVQQRLLNWAITWPMSAIDAALNSTTRNHQVDEVALSIWSIQTYKRYVRARLTDNPQGLVDRLFVPPNVADAISNAVFHGRHGEASGLLKDLWKPFGLEGMPRLILVLAKHRTDENHWVVHRYSLPDGGLTTYDTYPERTLPDGRPLGWWFGIRAAWRDAIYPTTDRIVQKMIRLHRPMQLPVDNSVAAAGIWRNLLMGSRAERSLDLERLRDLINTEVRNVRQRKQLGKLSISAPPPQPQWDLTN